MNTRVTERHGFAAWLRAEIRAAGLTPTEFARRVGVSHVTVSRWLHGRTPDAKYIDPIADVLLLDYDVVSEQAGYRPREPREQLEKWQQRLKPYLQKMDDTDFQTLMRVAEALVDPTETP